MKKKVLIIDDNPNNRKLMRVLLQKSGFETLEAEDGLKGIALAAEALPSLILMDIRMPVMDGLTAIKELKKNAATAAIPVIIITSSAMKGDRERIINESQCEAYISKPIELDSFIELVKKHAGVPEDGEKG